MIDILATYVIMLVEKSQLPEQNKWPQGSTGCKV